MGLNKKILRNKNGIYFTIKIVRNRTIFTTPGGFSNILNVDDINIKQKQTDSMAKQDVNAPISEQATVGNQAAAAGVTQGGSFNELDFTDVDSTQNNVKNHARQVIKASISGAATVGNQAEGNTFNSDLALKQSPLKLHCGILL